ncbi:MAG: AtpZ/AtpI family protein [Bacteroidota bacterium]
MKNKESKVSQKKQKPKTKAPLNNWVKYSSLSIQMVITILVGFFGGLKLDEFLQWRFPIFTVVLSLLAIFAALWFAIKDFLKK